MNFNLKTSSEAAEILKQLQASTSITPNILIRYAVSLSLKDPSPVEYMKKEPQGGLLLNRNTVTGEFDFVFHALIAQHSNRQISDKEYFPGLFSAHLERGIRLLSSEYKVSGSYEKFIRLLIQ
ncbi:DNA sulfur modification protein DndE [Paenibacillus athensensis]|uniref:DNA sulfur modification protein DndE n=1 Tax=Paenibacillus athensensis TaxID=1967502 RepID=A0A4Y8PRB8_9BACL|nr:DNA sulfur modification protein DndE [Paenibacillus athensensis]MCD1261998.1 DNA sulfur modification protein DndE [Paenibacillus athensensis]